MLNTLSASQSRNNISFLREAIRRNNERDVTANSFFCRIPKYSLCAFVPTRDHAIKVLAHNGIVRGTNNRGEEATRLLVLLLISDVQEKIYAARKFPFGIP